MAKEKSKPVELQPNRARTAVNLMWRKETFGYNAPEQFFSKFGKQAITFDQIRAAAQAWNVWKEAADSRGVPMQEQLFWETYTLQTVEVIEAREAQMKAVREARGKTEWEEELDAYNKGG